MRLTEAQRAELERRGWTVEASLDQPPAEWLLTKYGRGVRVTASGLLGTLYGLGMPFLEEAAEVCAVLGIAPPGYRLVPEEVLRNAVQVCDMHINLARIACNVDVTPLVRHTRAALASALQGEEVEKR